MKARLCARWCLRTENKRRPCQYKVRREMPKWFPRSLSRLSLSTKKEEMTKSHLTSKKNSVLMVGNIQALLYNLKGENRTHMIKVQRAYCRLRHIHEANTLAKSSCVRTVDSLFKMRSQTQEILVLSGRALPWS